MSYYANSGNGGFPAVPEHGPKCPCSVCGPQNLQNAERLSSTDRLAWLEREILSIRTKMDDLKVRIGTMGVALWCAKGEHAFDGNDETAERMSVDIRDPETGRKTGDIKDVHVCGRHARDLFNPVKRSLREIEAEIAEATEIGN